MKYFIAFLILFSWASYSADICSQDALNELCRTNSLKLFATMNAHVTFGTCTTKSSLWQEVPVLSNKFLLKKRGVLLSDALEDLLKSSSQSSFECNTAQIINFFSNLLSIISLDKIITELENVHEDFQFPLVQLRPLTMLREHNVHHDDLKNLEMLIEHRMKLQELYGVLEQANLLTSNGLQRTLPGGIIYLPNISGIETRSRGENLAFVDVDKQLYYGFNPAFKDGPKTLMETGDRLETIARENFAFLYELWAMAYSSVDRHEHHPFERMISPTTCLYINLQKVREFQARNL